MKKNHPSDGILVFDRYYGRKPVPALLAVGRVLFCALISAAAMLYIFSQYELCVPLLNVGLYAGISAVLFSVLFLFVKRRYAVPALIAASGVPVWLNFNSFRESFSYFADEAMLLVEGRFLHPREYLIHPPIMLTPLNPEYYRGILLGSFILCCLFSLLCAAAMARRIRCVPVAVGFAMLCIPRLLSETLEIDAWFIPFALLLAAAAAVELNYRSGLAVVRGGDASYRMQVREEEKKFLRKTDGAGMLKRTGMHLSYYSKYATTGAYCAVICALALGIGCSVFSVGESINYKELYSTITGFGDSPDDSADSSVSDYFTNPEDENGRLNIASPGSGNEDILRVTFTGDENIYLRGDIGVDFVDNSWTSPVSDDTAWNSTSLPERYRPSELLILQAVGEITGADMTVGSEIDIEYLTETDVVFLPAYIGDFSFYSNENFDIYGDYAVRVSDAAEHYINSVQCSALMLASDRASTLADGSHSYDYNFLYGAMFPDVADSGSVLTDYRRFVEENYTSVPDDMSGRLKEYLRKCGFYDYVTDDGTQMYRYNAAQYLSDYLADNYTYSLDGSNRGEDMLFSFLNVTKRGHCSLYASSMTLLLREAGIPARYCTGFSIYPDSVEGKTVLLKEKNLHAWVEVYLDEYGWVTFDPTSGAVSRLNSSGAAQEEETLPSRPETIEQPPRPEETREVPVPPTPTEPTQPEPDKSIPAWLAAVIIAAVVAAAAVILAVTAWHRLAHRAEKAAASAESRPAKEIYALMLDIVRVCGVTPEAGQLPVDYYRSCDKLLDAGLEENTDVLEAVTFGSGSISEEDMKRLCDTFRRLYASAEKNSGMLRRYKIRRLTAETL